MRHNASRGLLLAALLSATACAGSQWVTRDAIRQTLSPGSVLLTAPETPQAAASDCGLACLNSLLAYHGVTVDEEARRRFAIEQVEGDGIRAGDLRDYLRGRGFHAALVHGTLDHTYPTGIFSILDRGLPVIVELVIPEASPRDRHYVLVVGYDRVSDWILLMDPARGTGALPAPRFRELWEGAENLTLVAAPRGHRQTLETMDPKQGLDSL